MEALRALARSIRLVIARGIVRLVNDAGGLQVIQAELLMGETRDLQRMQNYGSTGVPPAGANLIAVAVGGKRSHLVVVAADDPASRPTGLSSGEYCIYTIFGDRIHLRDDRIVKVVAGTKLEVDAPAVHCLHDLIVDGNAHIKGTTTIDADLTQTAGSMNTVGNIDAGGDLNVTGGIDAGSDIVSSADVIASGISALHHQHTYLDSPFWRLTGEAE